MSALARACLVACLALASCSANDDARPSPAADAGPPASPPPESDAGPASDACTDCAFFPPTCSVGSFCPVAAQFDLRARLNDVKGTGASDVWVVGSFGTILHFDGHAWAATSVGSKNTLARVAIGPAGEIWAASSVLTVYVRSAGGGEWRAVAPAHAEPAMWGAVYAMTSSPASGWVWFGADALELRLMRMKPSDDAIAVDGSLGDIRRGFGRRVLGMHGASKDEIWAVGETGSGFRITNAESDVPVVRAFNTQTLATLHAVWAVSADEVWAVGGSGTVRRHRGANPMWEIIEGVPEMVTLRGVWASSSSEVWAVGDDAMVLHFDGTAWTRVPVAGLGERRPTLYSVWGADAGHVWASGDGVLLALEAGGSK